MISRNPIIACCCCSGQDFRTGRKPRKEIVLAPELYLTNEELDARRARMDNISSRPQWKEMRALGTQHDWFSQLAYRHYMVTIVQASWNTPHNFRPSIHPFKYFHLRYNINNKVCKGDSTMIDCIKL